MPQHPKHGDFTVGCGMFRNVMTDPCSCLVNEVRILDRVKANINMLWQVTQEKRPL